MNCPYCGGRTIKFGTAKRVIKTKYGVQQVVRLQRRQCIECHRVVREYPDNLLPYKNYERDLVEGVQEGLITSETLGFEDYPTEDTMNRWRREKSIK